VLPGISPTSEGGDMSLELELAEDPHVIRSIGSVGSIVGGPVSLTTDPVIIGTSNALINYTGNLHCWPGGLKGHSHCNTLCVAGLCWCRG
jgi:hypothetical protein